MGDRLERCNQDVADTNREGLAFRPEPDDGRGIIWQEGQAPSQGNWWAVEPELGRVAHGIPNRVDRLKCLGNAIVPQVAYEIIKVIAEIEAKTTAHFASFEQLNVKE